jgi:hypothetical protein
MKKRVLRVLLACMLSLSILSVSGFAVAFADPAPHGRVTPLVPECSSTRLVWDLGTQRVWTDTGNPNSYNQKLIVQLLQARDNVDNAFCNEMKGWANLVYRNVSYQGEVNASVHDDIQGGSQYDSVIQYANPTQNTRTATAETPGLAVNACGHATGEWFISGVIDIDLRVPASGYWCAP